MQFIKLKGYSKRLFHKCLIFTKFIKYTHKFKDKFLAFMSNFKGFIILLMANCSMALNINQLLNSIATFLQKSIIVFHILMAHKSMGQMIMNDHLHISLISPITIINTSKYNR